MKLKDINISMSAREKIERLKKSPNNIVGLSGGKDSMATCILLRWLEVPFKTVTAEVWWKKGITGENPRHYEWLHENAANKLNSWGVKSDFISSEKTVYELMTTPIEASKHPERIGKLRGFPLCGRCYIQRDCKQRPCAHYCKNQTETPNVIAGIASDEPKRLQTNTLASRISILEMLEVAESDAYDICASENLLSPTYKFSSRGGCWFCPNQKLNEWEILYREYPHLWSQLMEIQEMPNKVQEKVTRTKTLHDIERDILGGVQTRWFVGDLLGGSDG